MTGKTGKGKSFSALWDVVWLQPSAYQSSVTQVRGSIPEPMGLRGLAQVSAMCSQAEILRGVENSEWQQRPYVRRTS